MSIDELKREIERLSGVERHEISAFLSRLDLANDAHYWERVRRRANDDDQSHWVSVEQLASS